MIAIVAWIVSGILAAWTLISGAAGVAGAAALASAFALLPEKTGSVASEWINVANFFMPVNEAITFFITYCAIAGFVKVAKWTSLLKK